MPHWSVDDEPAEPVNMVDVTHDAAAAPTSPNGGVANPPPLAPAERVVELIEMLYLREPGFTGELLRELGNCSPAELTKLFGVPDRASHAYGPPAVADVSTVDTSPAEVSPAGTALLAAAQATPSEPRWDANGRRLNPGRRAFNYPMPQVRGSHWSR